MPKQIVIAEQHQIAAVFSEDRVQELVVSTGTHQVSDVYIGVVENVLPGIDAAFVNIGDPQINGFIHVSDLGPLRLRRSSGAITELLAPQQKVLVQVMKEPTGNKGPRLTGNITLPGRYLVLMPFGRGVNLSRRISSDAERSRLRALAILIKPAGMGLLVRTEAEGMPEEAILEDLELLQRQWEMTQEEAASTRAPALLSRDDDFIQRVLREMYNADVNRIVVGSDAGAKRVKKHLMGWNRGKTPQGVLIDRHQEAKPLLEFFRVDAAIREALKPRVELPSGGYIVIEPTEALTVIDVNSGSFTRLNSSRETVLWTNCEAATEIARQLRLRNIAGVIVVDFIDMDSHRDRLQVLENFEKALKADKARPQIVQLSELGLVELTRKRQGKNLYELFGRPCPTCNGLGHLVKLPGESQSLPEPERPNEGRRSIPEPVTVAELAGDRTRETAEEGTDLELANHPSYQEMGASGNNRRRRRRRLGDIVLKEESAAVANGESETPLLRAGRDVEADEETETDEAASNQENYSFRNHRLTRRDRRGYRREVPKPADEVPEEVLVEMTSEEQRLYAMMGISPLVIAGREVKNPRNANITIAAPGSLKNGRSKAPEATAPPPTAFPEKAPETENSPATPAREKADRAIVFPKETSEETSEEAFEIAFPKMSQEKPAKVSKDETTDRLDIPSAAEAVEMEEAANPDSQGSDNRRRRRRSSAETA